MQMTLLQTTNIRLVETKLRSLPTERFNFSHWVDEQIWEGKEDFSCGTNGCGLGWATTIPELRAQGYALRKLSLYGGVQPSLPDMDWRRSCEVLFGLTAREAEGLFLPDTSLVISTGRHTSKRLEDPLEMGATPIQLADRIAMFMAAKAMTEE